VPDGEHLVPIGVADVRRTGSDVTIVAWTRMVHRSLEAAEILAAEGIEVEVIDPRGVRPLDMDTILTSVRKTGRLIVTHEAAAAGGAGSEVVSIVAEQAMPYLAAPIRRLTAPDIPIPQSAELEAFTIPTVEAIVTACRALF
jgi:pyruvate dehydrogenase E1 component beta subunit